MESQGLLYKTRTYLIGNMQNVSSEEGRGWRDFAIRRLAQMGVIVFNPYAKPFMKDVDEGETVRQQLNEARQGKKFDFLCSKMREIRTYDLNLVDRSDFLIANINPNVASWGSAEEIVTGVRMKKPIFLSISPGGKTSCPDWIFGMFPHEYVFDSIFDIISYLEKVNDGSVSIDMNRWKLLRLEYR